MKFYIGSTRFVLASGGKAYKVARFRPIRYIFRLFALALSKKARLHFQSKYGRSFIRASCNDIFAGIVSNRREYSHYASSKDRRVIPTLRLVLHGLAVVQVEGGADVTQEEIGRFCLDRFGRLLPKEFEVTPMNCRHTESGEVVLVDYGKRETLELLEQTL